MAIIFTVSAALGTTLFGSLVITTFATIVVLELYGFLAIVNMQFQNFVAITLLNAVAITVEFIVHPVAAYEFAKGTRNQRVGKAMAFTAVPVLEGGISTFVSVSFLAGAPDTRPPPRGSQPQQPPPHHHHSTS